MASTTHKTLMSVEEYLKTSFEEGDCDYVDGEVLERNVGETLHSFVQIMLGHLFVELRQKLGIFALTDIRTQINPRRFRVPDVAVWRGKVVERIPERPPFLAVEILSPEDRMVRMQAKIADYLSVGVEYVWIIDPDEGKALIYSQQTPAGIATDVLKTENPAIEIPLADVLPPTAD